MKTCAYCKGRIQRGYGTYLETEFRDRKLLVHKKCEEDAKKLLEERGNGYYSLIMRGEGNPERLHKGGV